MLKFGIAAVDAQRYERLADLIDPHLFDPTDNSAFQEIVSSAIHKWGVSEGKFMDEFGISRGTVSRWVTGKNAPHPMARRQIVTWVRDRLAERAEMERSIANQAAQPNDVVAL